MDRRNDKLKIFVSFPERYWETKMSCARRHQIRAILRHPNVEGRLSGPGWADYDESALLQKNIDRILPDAEVIDWYKPLGVLKDGTPPLVESKNANGLKVERWNETWWPDNRAEREAEQAGTELAILHHANDAPRWTGRKVAVAHIPHCAEKQPFYESSLPWEKRDIPVLLTGVLSREFYPLRDRLAGLIRSRKVPGQIHHHPGYRLRSLEECARQTLEYARLLGRSKLVLGCTSRFRYRLARIPEICMAGALCVSDLPDQDHTEHERFIAQIDNGWPDSRLIETIRYWSEHDDEARRAAEEGQRIMLEHYTMDHYADRFVQTCRSFL